MKPKVLFVLPKNFRFILCVFFSDATVGRWVPHLVAATSSHDPTRIRIFPRIEVVFDPGPTILNSLSKVVFVCNTSWLEKTLCLTGQKLCTKAWLWAINCLLTNKTTSIILLWECIHFLTTGGKYIFVISLFCTIRFKWSCYN